MGVLLSVRAVECFIVAWGNKAGHFLHLLFFLPLFVFARARQELGLTKVGSRRRGSMFGT